VCNAAQIPRRAERSARQARRAGICAPTDASCFVGALVCQGGGRGRQHRLVVSNSEQSSDRRGCNHWVRRASHDSPPGRVRNTHRPECPPTPAGTTGLRNERNVCPRSNRSQGDGQSEGSVTLPGGTSGQEDVTMGISVESFLVKSFDGPIPGRLPRSSASLRVPAAVP
jgi:hypothetical protein